METAILIQARMRSERFPNKTVQDIGGKCLIDHVIDNCKESGIDTFVIAPGDERDQFYHCDIRPVLFGHPTDLLKRYLEIAQSLRLKYVIRVTGDCPFIDAGTIRTIYQYGRQIGADYFSNCMGKCVDGKEVEFISVKLLEALDKFLDSKQLNLLDSEEIVTHKVNSHREHVTSYLREKPKWMTDNGFKWGNYLEHLPYYDIPKLSVDTQEDLERVRKIYNDIHEKTT